ncbi:MAG: hypothetical protein U9Q90_06985 [Campylobacterota bacterium]|nr:hypothetical protein [Campylobacterota bacterium]
MNKLFLIFMFFTVLLLARHDAYPTKECPAFNNMKHSKNTHAVHLDTSKKYTVLKYHKGQALVLIKGEQPAQRWVDDECFSKSDNGSISMNAKEVESGIVSTEDNLSKASLDMDLTKNTKKYKYNYTNEYYNAKLSQQNLLALSWHNAFCETHRSKRECRERRGKRYSDTRFVLHGLWPQPRENIYCNVPQELKQYDKNRQWYRLPTLPLSEGTLTALLHLMPGSASNLHRHEWVKHGTCYGTDPESYFLEAISLAEQVNKSKVGTFFSQNIGKIVTLNQIRFKVDESFGKGSGKKVEIRCHKGMVTELWFHLGNGSDDLSQLLKEGRKVRSRCRKGRIDRVGF